MFHLVKKLMVERLVEINKWILPNKEKEREQTKLKTTDHDTQKLRVRPSRSCMVSIWKGKAISQWHVSNHFHQLNLQPLFLDSSLVSLNINAVSTNLILKRLSLLESVY